MMKCCLVIIQEAALPIRKAKHSFAYGQYHALG